MKTLQKEEIVIALQTFLSRCSISYRKMPMDKAFLALCFDEATKRGYMIDGPDPLRPFIPQGVCIAMTSYTHLEDKSAYVWLALYTACGIYCDDVFRKDTEAVALFCERLMRNQPQQDRALNAFAELILEISHHFPRVTSNIMVTSTLNALNALLIEDQTKGLPVSVYADNYPAFSRIMSGASEVYALAMFPPEIPVGSYIQALPSLMIYIMNVNDILSFYKEELAEETVNHISLIASARGCSPRDAFQSLIDETVEAHQKITHILEPDPIALDAYRKFAAGFVYFHISLDSRLSLPTFRKKSTM
ncbi:isoprenoid synthase domain-containing protein [Lentinula raphanica]|nr:isoprenoid synthase domain-containing protein [Lentinula raphanica]